MKLLKIGISDFHGSKLVINDLQNLLNVIRMPDWNSADDLFDQLLDVFFPTSWKQSNCRIDAELGTRRFSLFGRHRNGTLRTVDATGKAITVDPLDHMLSRVPVDVFLTVFTDQFDCDEFVDRCHELDLVELLVNMENSNNSSQKTSMVSTAIPSVDRLVEQIETLGESLAEWSPVSHSKKNETFAQLHQRKVESEQRRAQLNDELAGHQNESQALNAALSIHGSWEKLHRLSQQDQPKGSLEDLEELRHAIDALDTQVKRCRARIRKLKLQAEGKDAELDFSQTELSEISKHLDARDRALKIRNQIREFRLTERDRAAPPFEEKPSKRRSSRATLERLRPFARSIRDSRARLRELMSQPPDSSNTELNADPSTQEISSEISSLNQIAISELNERVAYYKDECARLLSPQVISKDTLTMIGMVAGISLLIIAYGAFGASGIAQWLAITLGVVGIVSAYVLKITSQRPSSGSLQYYRQQISALLDEIYQLKTSGGDDSADFYAVDGKDVEIAEAKNELANAKENWREVLKSIDLPLTLSPRALLDRFKRPREPKFDLDIHSDHSNTLPQELQGKELWLDKWVRHAYSLLGHNPDGGELDLEEICDRLETAGADPSTIETKKESRTLVRLGKQQDQLRKLKAKRKRELGKQNVSSLEELDQRISEFNAGPDVEEERARLGNYITTSLSRAGFETEARNYLQKLTKAEIENLCSEVDRRLNETIREIAEKAKESAAVDVRIREHCEPNAVRDIDFQSQVTKARLKKLNDHLLTRLLLDASLPKRPKEKTSGLQKATRYFQTHSPWRNSTLEYSLRDEQFAVCRNGKSILWNDLPNRVAEQVRICLQMAMVAVFAERGFDFPLILTGRWIDHERDLSPITASLLESVAKSGTQGIVISGDEASAKVFSDLGHPIFVVQLEKRTAWQFAGESEDSNVRHDQVLEETSEGPSLLTSDSSRIERVEFDVDVD